MHQQQNWCLVNSTNSDTIIKIYAGVRKWYWPLISDTDTRIGAAPVNAYEDAQYL